MKEKQIALTLGSGAALGYAHIGVLKFLEELNIKLSGIAGTSMGALVGGLYAYGYSAGELEKLVTRLNSLEIAKFFFPTFPRGGIIDSDNVKKFLASLIGDARIEDLSIPFRCVATDILTGNEVVFDSGPLLDGMIASMSIQGMFKPYSCKGLYLCDGGLCNPVPWDLGNELGDVNIIVNVLPLLGVTPGGKRKIEKISALAKEPIEKKEPGFLDVIKNGSIFDTLKDLMQDLKDKKTSLKQIHEDLWSKSEERQPSLTDVLMNWTFMTAVERRIPKRKKGRKQIILTPDPGKRNPLDFKTPKPVIAQGYEAAKEQEDRIRKLAGV
ncbi:MAG: patatin-like phospholipase family protein [Spirochaetales bacterium]|nr:patatin-like phospholipase family protein [Spirochaetales bacterium]